MNCASSTTNSAASENRVCTSHRALATGLRRVMHIAAPATASAEKVQNTSCVSNRSLPPGIRGVPQRRDGVRLRAQALELVDEPVARVLGILVMHADVDGLLGADLLAVATEHAAEFVDLVDQGVAVALLVLARHQL